jgi:flagellum-specific ATP synthase
MARSVVVVSTSDEPALARLRAAYVAVTVAEYFRDQGQDVMFLFDSVTRFAQAQREIGLSGGETPAQRSYPPSVFESMKQFLERSGTSAKGTITAFYTILVEGDDMDEPISDTARSILDGHIVLSRGLAEHTHYPAVDILASLSRCAPDVTGAATQAAVGMVRRSMAVYAENEILINTGAYKAGSNSAIDEAIAAHRIIESFLVQGVNEKSSMAETLKRLGVIAGVEISDDESL